MLVLSLILHAENIPSLKEMIEYFILVVLVVAVISVSLLLDTHAVRFLHLDRNRLA